MKQTLKNMGLLLSFGLVFAACGDDNGDGKPNGGLDAETKEVVNGNYSDYGSWTYYDLESGQSESHPDATEWIYTDGSTREAQTPEAIGIDWHIAIHRYEMKTNGGQVFNTGSKDFEAVTSLPSGGTWVGDRTFPYGESELEVITDMANMMQGGVGYSKNPTLNESLCAWVVRTETGSMPPTKYEPTNNVYVVKFADGSWAKLQFTDAGNTDTNASGYITWKYAFYPAE